MDRSETLKLARNTWEALLWLAIWLIAGTLSVEPMFPIKAPSFFITLFFGLPIAIIYAIAEYRYGAYWARRDKKQILGGLKRELVAVVLCVLVVAAWAYFPYFPHNGKPNLGSLLQSFAYARILYFFVYSIEVRARSSK
jgi:hypothetical protein